MNPEITATKEEACRFLLLRHGLTGDYRFRGKEGAYAYIRQCGCIQFDPVDVCGRNADLTLQSRVAGYRKRMLEELLYKDRRLVDYPDKVLSIFPTEDWPYFSAQRERAYAQRERYPDLPALEEEALRQIAEEGPASADTLKMDGEIWWFSAVHWSGSHEKKSRASRSVLEQMYTDGRLVIHHKEGTRKFYDLASRQLPEEILKKENPLKGREAMLAWRILRRIGAVGLLPDRASPAYLEIDMTGEERSRILSCLVREGRVLRVQVEGLRFPLYMKAEELPLLEKAKLGGEKARCEFLAPLDPLLWDKTLIRQLFGFAYSWEIYIPQEKRKYGYYVLPVLYGEKFIGRIEAVADRRSGTLRVRRFWPEEGVRVNRRISRAVLSRLRRFAAFNDVSAMEIAADAGLITE